MCVMEEETNSNKPVFLKYSWPPVKEEERNIENNNSAKLFRSHEKVSTNKIYEIAEASNQPIENSFGEDVTVSNDIYNSEILEGDPRKSFIIPEDLETYDAKVAKILNKNGAACKLRYLYSVDTERLTGPEAVQIAIHNYMTRKAVNNYTIDFLVNQFGITLTNVEKRSFFRKHFPRHSISYCELIKEYQGVQVSAKEMFAFVARKTSGKSNKCYLFRQLQQCEPAKDIVLFINIGYSLPRIE